MSTEDQQIKLADLLDTSGCVDFHRVNWTYQGLKRVAIVNGHELKVIEKDQFSCYAYLDGKYVDAADNAPDLMSSLLEKVAL